MPDSAAPAPTIPARPLAAPAPRNWDPIVKLVHWSVVAAVIVNALIVEEGGGWHIWVGYGLAAMLALRLLWGFNGSPNARFSAFVPNPAAAVRHIGDIRAGRKILHPSHNPLGALMVYAIWACLATITVSGVAMAGPPPADPTISRDRDGGEGRGEGSERRVAFASGLIPAAQAKEAVESEEDEVGEGEGVMEEVHEIAVNLLYALIALHILGVLFESSRHGPQIVRAMLPFGRRTS